MSEGSIMLITIVDCLYWLMYDQMTTLLQQMTLKAQYIYILKYSSHQISPQCCSCSILLGLTFVEIKKSFTKMLVSFNFKNFRIFFFLEKN